MEITRRQDIVKDSPEFERLDGARLVLEVRSGIDDLVCSLLTAYKLGAAFMPLGCAIFGKNQTKKLLLFYENDEEKAHEELKKYAIRLIDYLKKARK